MKVSELAARVEQFRAHLIEHETLWRSTFEKRIRLDVPRDRWSDPQQLMREQSVSLGEQLGELRPYLDRLHSQGWALQGYGRRWDALNAAVGSAPPMYKDQ